MTVQVSLPGTASKRSSAALAGGLNSLSALRSRSSRTRISRARPVFITLGAFLSLFALVFLLFTHGSSSFRRSSRRCLHWYLRMLHLHPLSARALSAAVIFFVADVLAQRLAGGKICGRRLLRYTCYGTFFMGPFLYAWYSLMNRLGPEDDFAGSLQKCVFEQVTLEPFCIVMYMLYDGVVCRRGWKSTLRRVSTAFVPLWFKNAVFWMPANFCNYYIGTPDLRVIFANLCSLFWNAYFSSKVNVPLDVPPLLPKYAPVAQNEREFADSLL